jgi:hypothetical protein
MRESLEDIAKRAGEKAAREFRPKILDCRRDDFVCGFQWGYLMAGYPLMTNEQIKELARKKSLEAFPDSMLSEDIK